MRTKTLLVGLGVALLAAPFMSSALTVSDLQSQLSSLLSQIQNLSSTGASASVSGNSGSALSGTVVSSCPSFVRSLMIGSNGSDVSALQQFLSAQGFLNVSATGYFGSLTRAAVGAWQVQGGVATQGSAGFGVFGPLSRTYFANSCGSTGTTQQPFSASPQSGAAPLSVTFTTNDSIASSAMYSVDFGDGTSGDLTKGECIAITAVVGGQGGIRCSFTATHTYSSNGTFTARLMKNTCPAGAECFVGPMVIATQTITVGSSQNSLNFSASPQSGSAPLTVQFSESAPQGTTLGNTINFGDGTSGTLAFAPTCSSCNAMAVVSHTYTVSGTYTATLTNNSCSCPANGICNCPNIPILGTATVTVGAAASSDQRINAPGSVTLQTNGIAEVRNENYYFTLQSLTSSTATIQLTPVGCWNSFPSDTPPQVRCMIAVIPTPPQTLAIGQTYASGNYSITLTQIQNGSATFTVGINPTSGY